MLNANIMPAAFLSIAAVIAIQQTVRHYTVRTEITKRKMREQSLQHIRDKAASFRDYEHGAMKQLGHILKCTNDEEELRKLTGQPNLDFTKHKENDGSDSHFTAEATRIIYSRYGADDIVELPYAGGHNGSKMSTEEAGLVGLAKPVNPALLEKIKTDATLRGQIRTMLESLEQIGRGGVFTVSLS